MKHNAEITKLIIQAKQEGYSSRAIAEVLGIGKSTVNDIYNRYKNTESNGGPKILLLDLETAATLSYHFDRWDVSISEAHVVEEGGQILVGCYKWLGEDAVFSLYQTAEEIKTLDDSRIVAELYDILEKANAVVMHNGRKFDHKVLQTRGVVHDYGKLPTVKIIDTLEIAKKKLKLPSNRLDSIGKYFKLGRKIQNSGIELWKQVQKGDKQAMKDMVEYCIQDVILLESVFKKLAHLGIDGFNAALYYDDEEIRCNVCGSKHVELTGRHTYTGVSKFSEYECLDCGTVSRNRKNKTTTTKRKQLLS